MDCSAKREVEEGMEEGVQESKRMHESEGLVHESESEPNLAGNSSGFNISFLTDKKPLVGDNPIDEPSSTHPSSTQMNFSSMPECFSEEYITGIPSCQPGAEYTKLMMDFLSSELEFNEFAM
ncbi:hypothetical protein MA16_Dca026166 [Dendrobium catenatum]|uniref:Uncharacterized protein n=1 Tax=Dendrobium catenatum TaxID=906689 RepID=A0A2I0VPF0_9ASPA|nr:hypothetical protein MA16_Dca026166 [Dendrobium catenatum]